MRKKICDLKKKYWMKKILMLISNKGYSQRSWLKKDV